MTAAVKKFRVFLRGENFWMAMNGTRRRLGFYTLRVVDAPDEAEAELRAVDVLRRDLKLRGNVLNDKSDPPLLFAEEIEETTSPDEAEITPPGLIFYDEAPEPTK